MLLTDYTTYADIRAALGVSSDELKDATLSLELYANGLQAELDTVNADLVADYSTVTAVAESSRTTAQAALYRSVRLFATYATARQLSSSLPLLAPKDVTDGKAAFSRFSDSPYKAVVAQIETMHDAARAALETAYGTYKGTSSSTATPSYLKASSPSTDPVTG